MKHMITIITLAMALNCCIFFMISAQGEDEKGRIVFSMEKDGNTEIFSMDIDGKNLKNLTNHAAIDVNPIPSPNGRYIAFISYRNGSSQIFIMDTDGTNLRLIIADATDKPTWSSDNMWLAFVKENRLVAVNINNSGALKEIFRPPLGIITPTASTSWSPDGKKIAFRLVGVEAGTFDDIFVMNSDGSNVKRISRGNCASWLEEKSFNIESEGKWKTMWGKIKRDF